MAYNVGRQRALYRVETTDTALVFTPKPPAGATARRFFPLSSVLKAKRIGAQHQTGDCEKKVDSINNRSCNHPASVRCCGVPAVSPACLQNHYIIPLCEEQGGFSFKQKEAVFPPGGGKTHSTRRPVRNKAVFLFIKGSSFPPAGEDTRTRSKRVLPEEQGGKGNGLQAAAGAADARGAEPCAVCAGDRRIFTGEHDGGVERGQDARRADGADPKEA